MLFGEGAMLQFFRNFFSSKMGVIVTLALVGLMALAFAGGDIASSGAFGGVAGGDRIATVGSDRISTSELERATQRMVEQMRQEDPKLTMKSFLAQGGLDRVIDQLVDLSALRIFGEKHGIYIGDRLIDSEIAKIPDVKGLDGKFSDQAYRAFLNQRGLTDGQFRNQVAATLMARQLLTGTELGIAVPTNLSQRYGGIVTERRLGQIAMLPSTIFAPKTPPSDAELAAWYKANQGDYMRPERRVIRYASFTDAVIKGSAAPTEAEVAARYNADKAKYAASETRKFSQLILPTEAAAKTVAAEIAGGKTMEAAAQPKGLSVAVLDKQSRDSLAGQASTAIADAAFKAGKGSLIGPLKAPLGWVLLRVDAIEGSAGKTLDQARSEIVTELTAQKRRAALTDYSARIEDEFDNGATLADVAKELGLTLTDTARLTADGQVFGKPGETAPALLARVVPTAFAMEAEGQPQLAEVEPGKTFVVFDAASIQPASAPPLAEIKAQVTNDYQLAKGAESAHAAAKKIEAAVKGGKDMQAAMAALGLPLPPVDKLELARQQVQQMGEKAPPPVSMLFAIAKGSVKLMAAPQHRGWYVVKAVDVIPGQIDANDPRLGEIKTQFVRVLSQEYYEQLIGAMRQDVGVKRNETAIKAVETRLKGGN